MKFLMGLTKRGSESTLHLESEALDFGLSSAIYLASLLSSLPLGQVILILWLLLFSSFSWVEIIPGFQKKIRSEELKEKNEGECTFMNYWA